MMRWWYVAAILVSLGVPTAKGNTLPDSTFDATIHQGIDHIYNLEFEKADEEFRQIINKRPGDPAGHFFLAMVQWWRILIDIDDESRDEQFYDSLDYVIDLCDEILEKNPNNVTALFFKGGAIGFKGRLRAHRSEWLAAANAGRKALPIVQGASQLDTTNYDIQLGMGIYDYYAEVIPDEYPFVKPLLIFVPPGDKTKGLLELSMAAEKGKYASIESEYFLMQIYYYFEKDYGRALALAIDLHGRFPNNMLFHKYLGRSYYMTSKWEKVKEVFTDIAARSRTRQRGYNTNAEREAEYYLGTAAMATRSYKEALNHFLRCDELSREIDTDGPSGFMVMANLKAGNLYDLLDLRDRAVTQYKKVLAMKEYKDSHTQAEQYLKSPYAQ